MIEMFLPPKLKTTFSALLALTVVAAATDCFAQSAEFEKRAAAMRRAISRGQQSRQVVEHHTYIEAAPDSTSDDSPEPVERVARAPRRRTNKKAAGKKTSSAKSASASTSRQARVTRVATAPIVSQGSGSRSGGIISTGSATRGYVPQHLRSSQFIDNGTIIDGGAPVISESIIDGGIVDSYSGSPIPGEIISSSYDQGIIIDDGYPIGGEVISGCGCGSSCNSCGVSGGYFEDGCCGRGGCPGGCSGGCVGPSLLGNLWKALSTGEYFGGAVAFQSPLFTEPGQTPPVDNNQLASDSSFGFYGGFNLGIPLCRLAGGLFSGQFGVRSVTTNFNGNEFSPNDRRQIFVTTGLYRRVDYGLQFGVVADFLHEEWFTETDLVQLRADIGWVYPAGHVFGFRYATGVKDETTDGIFNGNEFDGFFQTTDDNFRFYYRHAAAWGGYGEGFIGWAESSQTVIGLDIDLPVTNRVAIQSGFTAYLNDDVADISNFQGGNLNETWNLYIGLSFRPSGRSRYRSYDRPLFDVADNGSFVVRRNSPELNP